MEINNNKENSLKKNIFPNLEKYAVIKTGGKQYFVLEGKTIAVEKINGTSGDEILFDEVLLKRNNENVEIGQPFLKDPVKGIILKQMKGPKLVVFKFKRRKKHRTKKGHRQNYTVVRIKSI